MGSTHPPQYTPDPLHPLSNPTHRGEETSHPKYSTKYRSDYDHAMNEGNMSDYVTMDANGNNALRQQITYIHALNKDDVVSLGVRQTSGDTINITNRKLTIFKLSSNTFAE